MRGPAQTPRMQGVVWEALDTWDDRQRRVKLLSQAAGMLPGNSRFRSDLEELARGDDPRLMFRENFIKNYDAGRQFDSDTTLRTATRINRVLGDMILRYFPGGGRGSRMGRLALRLGRRLRVFIEAAIEPDGPVRDKQRWKLVAAYLLSLLLLALVCFPAFVLLLSSTKLWQALAFLVILVVTLPLSLIPLALTAGYNYAWLKLKGKLAALLPRTGGD